ncbi:MAG: glycoside hydrolase family 3 N-terminal domain-containing protein [Treponemataceae bacterium]|nr:MAG: glycoside hydrolase family 3 N-terminal domain-containing protein [Treponemataceae bacterium]
MSEKFRIIEKDGYTLYVNEGGAVIGTSDKSRILVVDGFAFKDLNRNGALDPYEDWRLPLEARVADLAARLSIEEIAGLMLYSAHQAVAKHNPLAMYLGQDEVDTRKNVWDLTEAQKKFLKDDNLRHVLVAMADSTEACARWSNNMQAFVEGIALGIPVNISSDPRHTPAATAEFDMGAGGDLSAWPDHLGLAATFDPKIVRRFGEIASKEYRAMGIATALSPQIDLATEPRWWRFSGTFGEGVKLDTDMAKAYCDGFQTSDDSRTLPAQAQAVGWGFDSVIAMAKQWPGGGSGEGGRDAHFGYGKFAVYPGGNFEEHLKPFLEGAFKLDGKTGKAAAVMPYYTVSWGIDTKNNENVGNNFSAYILNDLLRKKYGYDEVVCTDWLVTHDAGPVDVFFGGKCWGVENLSVAERHYKALMAGVDQFGGNNEKAPVLEAYELGVKEHGEDFMRERFRTSARRLLRNIFRTELFENPYLDAKESAKTAGCPEFVSAGREAQVKSVVMLKNAGNVLPLKNRPKVYVPKRHINAGTNFLGFPTPERDIQPVDSALFREYFDEAASPADADVAFCFIESPKGTGYIRADGYLPVSLQYRPYTAVNARARSIAGLENRSYRGKTGTVSNECDLDLVLDTKKAMGDKPVIVFARATNPFVTAEFESAAAAILLDFSVEKRALLDIAGGRAEPSGLLPFQMPRDMETVEAQAEDIPRDMVPYTDSEGNTYDFAYGLNWNGIIKDERVKRYGEK